MIYVTFYENRNQEYTAFNCIGHAEYGEYGEDIICAAVSALVTNTVNSIEILVKDDYRVTTNEEEGLLNFALKEGYRKESVLLLRSLVLGLQEIQRVYGNEFISLNFKEV